ncbi:MAG: alpha/beta hydrolase [Thaumarchaeota archaeon]|nr:alpha/beta hydrolase [Nitrososphaerota archaeon]
MTTPESESPGFVHRFVPSGSGGPITLLLLHGTGGSETDLLDLGAQLLPGAALLSPRGKVLENGMPRFFRRLAEGVFDLNDLANRTEELAGFVEKMSTKRGFGKKVVAVGYSNGANIAASLLLLRPKLLAGAVLFRPMVPFTMKTVPDLSGVRVLIEAGAGDIIVPKDQPEALAEIFRRANADVALQWHEAGHQLTAADIETARKWLSSLSGSLPK